jgi:hypothetical protein
MSILNHTEEGFMKNAILAAIILLLGVTTINAQESTSAKSAETAPTDPELKDLRWNRWTTENFTILAIDNSQGEWLSKHLEEIKSWGLTRWGFPDFKYQAECRVMCVPNKRLMKKLFNIETSMIEPRYKDGRLQMTVLWLVLDDKPRNTVPQYVSEASFYQFETAHNTKLGLFACRGMALLNSPLATVRSQLGLLDGYLKNDSKMFFSKSLMTMTRDTYKKEKAENKKLYDMEAMALCLMLRKEFGEAKMQGFLRISARNGLEAAMKQIYGFNDHEHFDRSFRRFMKDVSSDILRSRTPDGYLDIKPVQRQ